MPCFEPWPPLPLREWQDTYRTLHMWVQMVGKIRMTLSAPLNHWWHVTLYPNARGLTTSPIPYRSGGFEIQFDFLDHQLLIVTCDGARRVLPLEAESVAAFYGKLMEALRSLGIEVTINTKPQEIADPVPFEQDLRPGAYDRECRGKAGADSALDDRGDAGVPRPLHRQIEPAALLLGELRPGVDALLRARGASAQGRDHGTGVFARGDQRRLLAGRRSGGWSGILFLHGAAARGNRGRAGPPRGRGLEWPTVRIHPDVRRGSERGVSAGSAARFLREHVRSGSKRANWDRKALEA